MEGPPRRSTRISATSAAQKRSHEDEEHHQAPKLKVNPNAPPQKKKRSTVGKVRV